jgi:hypothetical protein
MLGQSQAQPYPASPKGRLETQYASKKSESNFETSSRKVVFPFKINMLPITQTVNKPPKMPLKPPFSATFQPYSGTFPPFLGILQP